MDKITILDQIRHSDNILSLPQALSEFLEEVSKEDYSTEHLSRIILKDPSLTSNILKLANSSYYKRITEVGTVHQAIDLLGVTTVKCLVLSSTVLNPERVASASGVNPKDYFTYVMSVAAACEKIAKQVGYRCTEECLIGGLLHEVGILFLIHHYPKEYRQALDSQSKFKTLTEAEQAVFGIDHCEIGYNLAIAWRLPESMATAIRDHHRLPSHDDSHQLATIVRLGVLLATERFSGFEEDLENRLGRITEVAEKLGMSKEEVDEASYSLLSLTIELAEYFGIDIGNVEDMLVRSNKEIWKSYLVIENLFKEREQLSRDLLKQEREKGAVESKNIAMATLSHYLNNAVMAIYGRSQVLRLHLDRGRNEKIIESLPETITTIDQAVKKVIAVLEEMKEISPIQETEFYDLSEAMNIDDRVAERMKRMETDTGLVIPVD
ncbi:MAG: HDOD domain-containing protein [Candidatus Zixiibacteriota bacterium]